MEIRLWQIVLVTFILLPASNVSGSTLEVLGDLELRAQYHLHSFKRDLDDIRALQDQITNLDDVELRSADGDMRWNLYLSPMLAFCEDLKNLNIETKNTTTPITTPASTTVSPHRDKDGFVLSTGPYEAQRSEWYLPSVRPNMAQAERDGTKVRLVFDVIHSNPAYVVRSNSFHYVKVFLETPADTSGPFLSRVQFVTDAYMCSNDNFDFEESYQFIRQDLEDGETFVSIDTCGFDKYQNMSLEYEQRKWLMKNVTVEEKPKLPNFRFVSKTNSHTIVRRDRNTQIDVEVKLDSTTVFYVIGSFYDYNMRIPLTDSVGVRVKWTGELQIERSKKNKIKLIKVKLLKPKPSNNTTGLENSDQEVNATVRITVLTRGTSLGGNLVIRDFRYRNDYYNRTVFETVGIDRILKFNQPGEQYPPPDLEPQIYNRKISVCTDEGNEIFPREGRNCTMYCNGFGPNMFSISITKNDSKLIPYRSVSYILNNTAFAMIDVGPASSENEGSYVCVVESSSGRVTSSSKLYTSGLPKILHEESTLVQFENGSSEVTCKATGAQPLKMKMSLNIENGPYKRIDNNPNYFRTKQQFDKGMVLKLRLPTKDLKFPKYILKCEAENIIQYDMKQFYLYNDVNGYYDPVAPKLDDGSTRIASFKNGTTAITCKATGAFPLDVMVLYGGRSEYYRIDNDPSNVKIEESTTESKTATLMVNTKSIKGRTSWLHCFAKNEYGTDILDYDLYDYI